LVTFQICSAGSWSDFRCAQQEAVENLAVPQSGAGRVFSCVSQGAASQELAVLGRELVRSSSAG
jgi:hypothetical protein